MLVGSFHSLSKITGPFAYHFFDDILWIPNNGRTMSQQGVRRVIQYGITTFRVASLARLHLPVVVHSQDTSDCSKLKTRGDALQ